MLWVIFDGEVNIFLSHSLITDETFPLLIAGLSVDDDFSPDFSIGELSCSSESNCIWWDWCNQV